MNWQHRLTRSVQDALLDVDEFVDVHWRRFAVRMGFGEARHIAAYRGYGNGEFVWVRGRLLGNRPYGGPQDDDNWWDNLQATYQRWESDEIRDAEIELEYDGTKQTVRTDREGYYTARFPFAGPGSSPAVIARHRSDDGLLIAEHHLTVPSPEARYLVISDMDDTVIHTGITDLLLSAQLTFLYNAKTRKPLAGVGALYRELAGGTPDRPRQPVVYVSNSGWNMYDLLRDFLDLNDLPRGPLLLRDLGLSSDSENHKIDTLRKLLRRFPEFPVVLIGDSGQHDAEIYSQVALEHPRRVRAIYIRDVDPDGLSEYDDNVDRIIESNRASGVPFLRVQDSGQIAEHAIRIGLLEPRDQDEISVDVRRDRQRETVAEELVPGG